MPIHNSAQQAVEALLARYERIIKAATIMSDQEKAELSEWEKKHVSGGGDFATSDWPGWEAIINRVYMGSDSINMLNEDMARLPRYFVKGVPLHITLRANNRNPIFGNDDDYQFFKECLLDEYSWSSYPCTVGVRACLLPNSVLTSQIWPVRCD